MALHSGFAQLAARETQILVAKATAVEPVTLSLQEIRSQRKAAKRRLRELRDLREVSTDQIEFALPSAFESAPEQQVAAELQSLEEQMRIALGLDAETPAPVKETVSHGHIEFVAPTPQRTAALAGVEQASETTAKLNALEKEIRGAFGVPKPEPKAEPAKPKAKTVLQHVKRQIEVMLQVRRADGTQIPFYHLDDCTSKLEAELNAAKKARKFGLSVLHTIEVAVKEYDRQVTSQVFSGAEC